MDLGAAWRRIRGRSVGSGGGSARAAGAAPAGPPPIVARRAAWRDLPPIQRAVHPAPLVAPNDAFEADLAGHRPAPVALAPLGHAQGLSAPNGIVTGVAHAREAAPPEAMPTSVRPVRGRAPHDGLEAGFDEGGDPTWSEAAPPVRATVADGGAMTSAPPVGAPGPGTIGRAAASVSRSAIDAPSTTSAASPGPGGTAGLPALTERPSIASAGVAASPSGLAAPIQRSAAASAPSPAAPASSSPAASGSASAGRPGPGVGATRNLGQSRRLRLGPALETRGGSPLVARAATGAPNDSSALPPLPAPRSVARASAGADHDPLPSPEPGGAGSADGGAAPGGHGAGGTAGVSVSRSTAAGSAPAADGAEPGGLATDAEPVIPVRPIVAARMTSAPLAGTLRPAFSFASPAVARRAADPDDAEPAAPTGVAAALAALARSDPGGPPPSASGTTGLFGASGGGGSPVGEADGARMSTQRAPADDGEAAIGPFGGPVVARSAVGASTAPTIRRLPGSGGTSATARSAAALPSLAGLLPGIRAVQRSGAGRLARPPGAAGATDVARSADADEAESDRSGGSDGVGGAGLGAAPVIARLASDAAGPSAPVGTIQRAEAGEAPASGGGAAGGSGESAGQSERELDDLARKLYDRIGIRLRRELLVDRERAGSLIDLGR